MTAKIMWKIVRSTESFYVANIVVSLKQYNFKGQVLKAKF